VYYTCDYWVFGLFLSYGVLKNVAFRELNQFPKRYAFGIPDGGQSPKAQ
jgi:hypothetical protein